MPSSGPPRVAESMIGLVLDRQAREFALGDLAEEHARVRRRRGASFAHAWYWLHAIRTVFWYMSPGVAPTRGGASRASPARFPEPTWRSAFESMGADILLGARRAAHRPGALLVAILMLSLAVGGSTAMIGAMGSYGRWSPGLPSTQELSALAAQHAGRTTTRHPASAIGRIAATEVPIAAVAHRFAVSRDDMGAQTVWGAVATPSLFRVIGVKLLRGRMFTAAGPEAVISHRSWMTRFDGREDAIGTPLWVNGEPLTIVGIAEPDFKGLMGRPSLWQPLDSLSEESRSRLSMVVLATGSDRPRLEASASQIAETLADPSGETPIDSATWVPASNAWFATSETSTVNRANVMVGLLAILVVAAACANVANIHLADGLSRRTEMAVRAALGASRGRVLRQLLVESLVLAGGVCAGSYAVAMVLLRAVPLWLPTPMPGFEQQLELPLDVLTGGLVATLAVTAAATLFPPLRLTSGWSGRQAARSGVRGYGRLLERMGGIQVATAAALTLVALFLSAGMDGVHDQPLGYVEEARYSFTLDGSAIRSAESLHAEAYRRFFARLAESPSVAAVGVASMVPGFLGKWTPVRAEGSADEFPAGVLGIDSGYLRAAGTSVLDGRDLRADDAGRNVALLTQTLATALWGRESAVGKAVQIGPDETALRIVGVVEDGTYAGKELLPVVMRPLNAVAGSAFVVVHERAGITSLRDAIQTALRSTHSDLSAHSLAPVSEWFDRHRVLERSVGAILGTLALFGLVISGVGIYAGFTTLVVRRRRELGIRMSLGASPRRLLRSVLKRAAWIATYGYLAGTVLAAAGSRLVQSYLFGSGPWDPYPYFAGLAITMLLTLAAAVVPARHAARVDPVRSMRHE